MSAYMDGEVTEIHLGYLKQIRLARCRTLTQLDPKGAIAIADGNGYELCRSTSLVEFGRVVGNARIRC